MTAFIVLATLMTAAAIATVAWSLLRPAPAYAGDTAGPARPDRRTAILIAVLVPVVAALLYHSLSNWPWDPAAQISAADNPHGAGGPAGSMDAAVKELEAKLAANPADVEGWRMLARSYIVTERFDRARDAYAKLVELTKGADVDAVLGLAEARVLVDDKQFDGEAGATFERIATQDPGNAKALWYAGVVAYRKQDWKLARERWSRLQSMDLPPNIREVLGERIAELDSRLGIKSAGAASAAAAPAPATAAASPSSDARPAPAGSSIALRVDVAPALRPLLKPDAALFVLGRPPQGGPPVAVVRRTAGELPFDLVLTDDNVMTQGMTLGMFGELTVVARVSFSGRPMATSGDLYGEIRYDFKGDKQVALIIDRVVP